MNAPLPQMFAGGAAESIRSLNHATLAGGGYQWPSDVDATVAELETAISRLPQALGQAGHYLQALADAGDIGTDDGHDVDARLVDVLDLLARANAAAGHLAAVLSDCHQLTATLTGVTTDDTRAGS